METKRRQKETVPSLPIFSCSYVSILAVVIDMLFLSSRNSRCAQQKVDTIPVNYSNGSLHNVKYDGIKERL